MEREVAMVPDHGVWWMRTGVGGQSPEVLMARVAASGGPWSSWKSVLGEP